MLAQAIGYSSEEDVIQNLQDAGCSRETIEGFMRCMSQDDLEGQMQLMKEHRKCLLDRVHRANPQRNEFCPEEKQISCLDYLVYQMGRNKVNV